MFKNPPEPTLAYTIGKDEIDGQVQTKSIQWNYSIIKTSIPFGSEDPCLPSAFDVIDPVTGAAPNPLIFEIVLDSSTEMSISIRDNIQLS